MKNLLILLLKKNMYENMKENIKDINPEENNTEELNSLKRTTL